MRRERERSGRFAPRTLAVLAVALFAFPLLVPGLGLAGPGHDGPHDHPEPPPSGGGFIVPPVQGTAPRSGTGPEYYSWYQSGWIYGQHEVTVLGDHYIRQLAGNGEWLVWINAHQNDVFAYNVPAGDGFYVTQDGAEQYVPQVDDNVIVWEDRRNGPAHVYAYFLETGETRRLSQGGDRANHVSPKIDYPYVAWSEDSGDDWQVVVHDLQTGATVNVSDEGSRDTDPVVMGSLVVWRTYRFNVWDVMWFDMATGESGSVTSDRKMESQPFTNGREAFFMKQSEGGWELYRFHAEERRSVKTPLTFPDLTPPAASGERFVQPFFEATGAALYVHNLTSGYAAPASGYLPLTDVPAFADGVLYAPVWNGSANAILAVDLSEHAFRRPPRLVINSPEDGDMLRGPTRVSGRLTFENGWQEPDFFGYSINGANFTTVSATPEWSFFLDMQDRRPDMYTISVEVHFEEAPPVVQTFTVGVPQRVSGVDVEEQAERFQLALMNYYWHRYVGQNPAVVALFVLALVVVGLWFTRYRLRTQTVRRAVIEYVPQPEEEDPYLARPKAPRWD